jgi:hypothetical protein
VPSIYFRNIRAGRRGSVEESTGDTSTIDIVASLPSVPEAAFGHAAVSGLPALLYILAILVDHIALFAHTMMWICFLGIMSFILFYHDSHDERYDVSMGIDANWGTESSRISTTVSNRERPIPISCNQAGSAWCVIVPEGGSAGGVV